jgi:putative transposase
MQRKSPLATGETYHVFNKSIADYVIFNTDSEYDRMIAAIQYYRAENKNLSFSRFIKLSQGENNLIEISARDTKVKTKIVEIIAYCVMPTHFHLVLQQLQDNGISVFMNNILNSYSKYFNIKHKRKGPLWEGRFKNVLVDTDEYLFHLTRYMHLNPVTASLTDRPGMWKFSSYNEYILGDNINERICEYRHRFDIKPKRYKKFVEDRISYQKELAKIKHLLFE